MAWRKLGLLAIPAGLGSWAQHSALTPTPVVMQDGRLRVYAGFRDRQGVSRIGWIDLDPRDPTRTIGYSTRPALDIGRPGCFDDNGVILGDVIRVDGRLRLYYVGFQLVEKAKFLAFSGVAESDDGNSFTRLSEAPLLDRSDEGLYIRALHSVRQGDGKWQAWYAIGSGWQLIEGKPFPRYQIAMQESDDGLSFAPRGTLCLPTSGREYRIGRPRVWTDAAGYHMFFTFGTLDGDYLSGYASSPDGVTWVRDDRQVGIAPSSRSWDSKSVCYLAPLRVGAKFYVFYNGNDMGRAGFGCAEIEADAFG